MSQSQTPESGQLPGRYEVVRETTTGETPADPAWLFFSDDMQNFSWTPDGAAERRDTLGDVDPVEFNKGPESHELVVAYSLQRSIVDGNGDPNDPAGDAMLRTEDNQIPNTHSILAREKRTSASPDEPSDVVGARTYTVAKGGKADWNMEGDPEEGEPVPLELTYTFEKVRPYHIYQPGVGENLAIQSTNADDTTQSVTIEGVDDTGSFASETVALSGTSPVSTSTIFSEIDAVELDVEAKGNVTVHINDGTETSPTAGTELTTIYGALEYSEDDQPVEGDLGVPTLGVGSRATEIGTTYEHFIGDSVQQAGEDIAYDLNNFVAEGDNGIDTTPRTDTMRQRVHEGNREVTQTADVIGERETHDRIMDALRNVGDDIVWVLSNTRLTFPNATVVDSPDRSRETDQATAEIGVGFESDGITVEQI